jgi:hypothetical protein
MYGLQPEFEEIGPFVYEETMIVKNSQTDLIFEAHKMHEGPTVCTLMQIIYSSRSIEGSRYC